MVAVVDMAHRGPDRTDDKYRREESAPDVGLDGNGDDRIETVRPVFSMFFFSGTKWTPVRNGKTGWRRRRGGDGLVPVRNRGRGFLFSVLVFGVVLLRIWRRWRS